MGGAAATAAEYITREGDFSMPFEFATAGRIVFGRGVLRQAGYLAREVLNHSGLNEPASHALVVTGRDIHRAEPLVSVLKTEGIVSTLFAVAQEPTTDMIRSGVARAIESGCNLVLGMGGGSVVDAGKAIAALAANRGDLFDYLEVVGKGKALEKPSLPYIAIPTTAGTGSEVTRNAVVLAPEHGVKVSLRSPHMLPSLALVDPELTYSLPASVTASTGLDAFTQLVEPFVSHRANAITDCLCREGIARVACSLRRAFQNGRDEIAREDMSLAGLFGGLALANAGLGAVHGFAGPIGGMFSAPHGAVCAALLPHVMSANVRAMQQRDPNNPAVDRYREIARIVIGRVDATIDDGVQWVAQLVTDLKIPGLGSYGIRADHTDEIVAKSQAASSMKGNPLQLTTEELAAVLNVTL